MESGTNYYIVGAADCPYYARSERLGQILTSNLGLGPNDIQYEMKSPEEWPEYFKKVCSRMGFVAHYGKCENSKERVLVYSWRTNKLVGEGRDFREEVEEKYSFPSDISWAQCNAIAAENLELYKDGVTWKEKQTKKRETTKPCVLLLGPPHSSTTVHAGAVAAQYGVNAVSLSSIAQEAIAAKTKEGRACEKLFKAQKYQSAAKLEEPLPSALAYKLVKDKLLECSGWVLSGFPRSVEEVEFLEDNGFEPHLSVLLELTDDVCLSKGTEAGAKPDRIRSELRTFNANIDGICSRLSENLSVVGGERVSEVITKDICRILDSRMEW